MKECKQCGGSDFTADNRCRPCRKAYLAAYRIENKEKLRELRVDWRNANKEKVASASARYRLRHKEELRRKDADYYARNKIKKVEYRKRNAERIAMNQSEIRAANPEKRRAYDAMWRRKNPEKKRAQTINRRARLRGAYGRLSPNIKQRLFALQNGKCACCGQPLGNDSHLDHIVPLALGGENIDSNMQLLLSKCNLQKSSKHPTVFMRERGFLL